MITPTKGRHRQLDKLLETLAAQTVALGQILIADGGQDAEQVVARYRSALPVTWLPCPQPGQIPQRNYALQQLDPAIKVVIYFDDDIQLAPDALETLLAFWNAQPVSPAGVSFNITNMPAQPDNPVRHFFCMQTEPRGKVLRSGYNTPVVGAPFDLRSEWLIGGATAWRRDLLASQVNQPIASRWAITEDLMYSYRVFKSGGQLFVCAAARVQHIDDTPTETFRAGLFRGYNATLWRYLFVARNPELSRLRFFWMMLGHILARMVSGATGKTWQFGYVLGHIEGLFFCLVSLGFRVNVERFLR